ncbi:MAG: sigma-70 family RNA polymerase sigma factor [Ilumatobacteraceae bacterium]
MKAAANAHSQAVSPEAFAVFYDKAFAEVYRYLAAAVFGDQAVAEDLTQETFASVVTAVRDGRAVALTMPWLMGVARHKLIDHYRNRSREQRRLAMAWAGGLGDRNDRLEELEDVEPGRVVALLQDLSPTHRLVLVLKYLDDLSVDEIASEIGRSVHATESLLARARQTLARSHREAQS